MVDAAATQWVIERLEEWMAADMNAELDADSHLDFGDDG